MSRKIYLGLIYKIEKFKRILNEAVKFEKIFNSFEAEFY
jgi:hypothetical protein